MKKIILIACIISHFGVNAQSTDNAKPELLTETGGNAVSVAEAVVNNNHKVDSLTILYQSEKSKVLDLQSRLNSQNDSLKTKNKVIKENRDRIEELEKSMIIIASNFLYIPYEDYSINKIAIPAYESVKSPDLKLKYNNRYVLLKNYVDHVNELKAFLISVNDELGKSSLLRRSSNEIVKSFEDLKIYKDYTNYADWDKTYLGSFLMKVKNKIFEIGDNRKENGLESLIRELDSLKISK